MLLIFLLQVLEPTLQYTGHPNLNHYYTYFSYRSAEQEYWQFRKMTHLHYFSVLAHSGVQSMLCCVFDLFVFVLCLVSCVPNVASFSGMPIADFTFGFL
jgi:hypothetical protein